MIPVYPLTEETLLPHVGSPVLAVLQDGQEHVGFLHQVRNGRLTLGEAPADPVQKEGLTHQAKKARTKASQRKAVVNQPTEPTVINEWEDDPWPDPFFSPPTRPNPPSTPAAPVTLSIKSLAGFYLLFV